MILNTGPLDWESSALTTRPKRHSDTSIVFSNRDSDTKSLDDNHVADYNLGFLVLVNPLFNPSVGVILIFHNVEKNVNNFVIDAG